MSSAPSSSNIFIDISKDLTSASALQSLLTSQEPAGFQLLGGLNNYATRPVSEAAAAKASASVSPTKAASWKTGNDINFSLTPTAKCTITVALASESFSVAMNIESTNPQDTRNVSAGPTDKIVYVNIDLDFDIKASVSGTGSAGAFGVSGKASGDAATTLSFCQPVSASLSTLDAIKMAFEQIVFPLDPSCTDRMQTGTVVKVAFDGSINCELDATYGLGNYKVAAPDLTSVQQCLGNVTKLQSPSATADVGIKGSVTYCHTSHFALIVNKTSDTAAMVYLVRSSEDDTSGSVGVDAGITTCAPSVSIDPSTLGSVAQSITGNATIASAISSAATAPANDLVSSLNGKLKNWASSTTGDVGLSVGLSRQSGHTALFVFAVDLANPETTVGWADLVGGSVSKALGFKGFTLQAGSGVSDSLKRAATLKFQLFNFFSFSSTSDYFSNGYTEFGKDGTIHILRDLGKERENDAKNALKKFRLYFEATASQNPTTASIANAQVDLCIELSEKGNSKYAASMANVIGFLPGSLATNAAQEGMTKFVNGRPSGTLDLKITLRSSAYGKLSASPFNSKAPPPLPQQQDADNWQSFQTATESLNSDLNFVGNLTYKTWTIFNVESWDQVNSTETPDRHQTGDPANVPSSFLGQYGVPGLVAYFLEASQCFMNLCDDLKTLAAGLPSVESSAEWTRLLSTLTHIMTKDVYLDYGMPTCGALLLQCSENGVQTSGSLTSSADGNSLTCLIDVD
jgi:hypothetical protein